MIKTIPELTNYVANAYNAKNGHFLGSPIFKLTYGKEYKVSWKTNEDLRDIPDQISVSTATTTNAVSRSILLENESEYDHLFSISMDIEYSGVTYSGSARSSLLYHGNLFQSKSSQYALNFFTSSVLIFQRRKEGIQSSFHDSFVETMRGLPTDISTEASKQLYYKFFDYYGTHYADSATLGGAVVMETEIKESLSKSSESLKVSGALEVGANGILTTGKMNINTAFESSTFLKEHARDLTITLNSMGGHFAADDTITNWSASIYDAPIILLNLTQHESSDGSQQTALHAISRLAEFIEPAIDRRIADNINNLYGLYMAQDESKLGLLTDPIKIDFDREYSTKNGNGFVICTINGWPDYPEFAHGDLQAVEGLQNGQNRVRMNASWNFDTHHNQYINCAALTMPTGSNTSYALQPKSPRGPGSGQQKLIQLIKFRNIGDEAFGSWVDIELNNELIAPGDGFVVGYVDCGQRDGIHGKIKGEQRLDNDYETVAGASQQCHYGDGHFVFANSFCMPVRKNMHYRVHTEGNSFYQAFFVPISKTLVFSNSFMPMSEGTVHSAQTDGFLVAYITTQTESDRGFVDVYSNAEAEPHLTERGKIAATSIHASVSCNTVMIPVRKNTFYKAIFTKNYGNPIIYLRWIPLERQKPD